MPAKPAISLCTHVRHFKLIVVTDDSDDDIPIGVKIPCPHGCDSDRQKTRGDDNKTLVKKWEIQKASRNITPSNPDVSDDDVPLGNLSKKTKTSVRKRKAKPVLCRIRWNDLHQIGLPNTYRHSVRGGMWAEICEAQRRKNFLRKYNS